MPPVVAAVQAAGARVIEALAPWETSGKLFNFLGTTDAGPAAVASVYPAETTARLLELKDRFDPHNIFRHGHALKGR